MNLHSAGVDDARLLPNSIKTTDHLPTPTARDAGLIGEPAVTMGLLGRASSDSAKQAIERLGAQIYTCKGKPAKPSPQYVEALGAVLGDLLKAASYKPRRVCFRPMAAGSFSGAAIGYVPCRRVLADLERDNMVAIFKGTPPGYRLDGVVTRVESLPALTEWLARLGITSINRSEHFVYRKAAHSRDPIRLKSASIRTQNWKKINGKPIPVEMSQPSVIILAEQMKRINAFLSRQTICDMESVDLFRGYNCGDDPAFKWSMGGRIYADGFQYQAIPKNERKSIMINGMETVEIDISACHLTIIYGLFGADPPEANDIYYVDGLDRSAVKLFVNSLLGGGSIPLKWNSNHQKVYGKEGIRRLSKDYPLSKITKPIMEAMPILQRYLCSDYNWATLQNIESDIMAEALDRLATDHQVCGLPVHDSIIVSKSHKEITISCLSKSFYKKVGIYPIIK